MILANAFERPGFTARNEGELDGRFERQHFVHFFAKFAAAHLRAGFGHIKKGSIVDIEPLGGPQIAQCHQVGFAYQSGDGTLISDVARQRGGRIGGGHSRSVPQAKPELKLHPLVNVVQHEFECR